MSDAVRGHLCDGLAAFQAEGGGCTPRFWEDGSVESCDGTNDVRIVFCPFCGVELAPWEGEEPRGASELHPEIAEWLGRLAIGTGGMEDIADTAIMNRWRVVPREGQRILIQRMGTGSDE